MGSQTYADMQNRMHCGNAFVAMPAFMTVDEMLAVTLRDMITGAANVVAPTMVTHVLHRRDQ